MINDCMKNSKIIGLIQPRKTVNNSIPDLYNIGCAGKIKNINETQDGRYLVMLHGISRFKILKEIKTDKLYRECEVNYNFYNHDLEKNDFKIETSELNSIFKDVKLLFKKQGYSIDWKAIEKQNTNQTINALSMASPFSLEEKQILLESINLETRKIKLEQILKNYTLCFRSKYGVADIDKKSGSKVYGALYKISKSDESKLDIYEEYPTLYKKMFFKHGKKIVMAYIMVKKTNKTIPTTRYFNTIKQGYRDRKINLKSLKTALQHSTHPRR